MIVIVVGRRGQGKTTLAVSIAKRCESRVILDPRRSIPNPDPIGDLPADRAKLESQMADPHWPEIVVRAPRDLEGTNAQLATFLADVMLDPTGKIAIMLDEGGLLDFKPWDPYFRTAHPVQVVMIVTAHRLQDIPARVRALADWFCLFRTTEPNDLDLVQKQCGASVADLLPSLGPRVFVRYDASATDDNRQIQTFRDPHTWYVPMDAPQFTQAIDMEGGESPRRKGLF